MSQTCDYKGKIVLSISETKTNQTMFNSWEKTITIFYDLYLIIIKYLIMNLDNL